MQGDTGKKSGCFEPFSLLNECRRPSFSARAAVALRSYDVPQVFFHILILDALNYSVFAAIENRFPGDGTVTVLSLSALFFVDQMPVLLRHNFCAVLDLEDLAGTGDRVKYHHVELTHGKLQDKHLLFGVRQLGFQQDNVFQHPPFDLVRSGRDSALNVSSSSRLRISASACA